MKEGKAMELQKVQRTTLTMKEAAEYLGISYWLVNQLVRRKQIPCSKVGGKYLFRVQVLDEYLKNMEHQSIS
jgi:DNA binding domain protein, excisionase family